MKNPLSRLMTAAIVFGPALAVGAPGRDRNTLTLRSGSRGFELRMSSLLSPGPTFSSFQYTPKQGETVLQMDVEGKGSIFIRLHTKEAPRATAHIANLARKGFYDGQRFFEVIRTPRPYLVRFGDPLSRDRGTLDTPRIGTGGTGAKIPFENTGFRHERGAVGLATPREDKNAGDCQFYIMLASAGFLDGNYTIFGHVVSGMDVVDRVEKGDLVVSVKVLGGG